MGTYTVETFSPNPRMAAYIGLVRWELGDGGWRSELVSGQYRGRTQISWLLDTPDGIKEFDRKEWEICLA